MSYQLLISANNPGVPDAIKQQAISVANTAIMIANNALNSPATSVPGTQASPTSSLIIPPSPPSVPPQISTLSISPIIPEVIAPVSPPTPAQVLKIPHFSKDPYIYVLRPDFVQIKVEVENAIGTKINCYEGDNLIHTSNRLVEAVFPIKSLTSYHCTFQLMDADANNNGIFLPDTKELNFITP
jgi:hypothetical protein